MTSLDKIDRLWQDSMARIDSNEFKSIADALAARGAEIIHAMIDLSVANGVSPSMRIRAAAIVFAAHARLTKTEVKTVEAAGVIERAKARRESAKSRHARLRIEELEAKRKEEKRKRVAARKLADALAQVAQQTEEKTA